MKMEDATQNPDAPRSYATLLQAIARLNDSTFTHFAKLVTIQEAERRNKRMAEAVMSMKPGILRQWGDEELVDSDMGGTPAVDVVFKTQHERDTPRSDILALFAERGIHLQVSNDPIKEEDGTRRVRFWVHDNSTRLEALQEACATIEHELSYRRTESPARG